MGTIIFKCLEPLKIACRMKNLTIFLAILSLPLVALAQDPYFESPLLSVKVTPTSLFNPVTPTYMAGVEIWPFKKVSFQFEYGHQTNIALFMWTEEKEDWFYRRNKFSVRFHFYRNFSPVSVWKNRERKRWLLPTNRRSYVGLDLVSFPQSYTDLNGEVLLEDGRAFAYTDARIHKNAMVLSLVSGSQIPLSNRCFIEIYFGLGVKWKTTRHELDTSTSTPIDPFSVTYLSFLKTDEKDGKILLPYGDFGIKIGYGLAVR